MKRVTVVVVVVLVLGLTELSQAADLKAGWYADVFSVTAWDYGPGGSYIRGWGQFLDTPPRRYGPFQVSDGPDHSTDLRLVSVPTDASGIDADQSLDIPLRLGINLGDPFAYGRLEVRTLYDPSQMYLQLWHTHSGGTNELLWEDKAGDGSYIIATFNGNGAYDGGYYFRVNVVPEPSTVSCLLLGAAALMTLARRRR